MQTSVIGDNGLLPRFNNLLINETEESLIASAAAKVREECEIENCYEIAFVEVIVRESAEGIVADSASPFTFERIEKLVLDKFLGIA